MCDYFVVILIFPWKWDLCIVPLTKCTVFAESIMQHFRGEPKWLRNATSFNSDFFDSQFPCCFGARLGHHVWLATQVFHA